jgi:hypothetical protein
MREAEVLLEQRNEKDFGALVKRAMKSLYGRGGLFTLAGVYYHAN